MPLSPVPIIPDDAPKPFSVWRHFKGHDVVVVDVFIHTETGEILVSYMSGDERWARPLSMWADNHASGPQRFTFVSGRR